MKKQLEELRGKAAIAAMSALLPSYEAPLPDYLEKKGISPEEYWQSNVLNLPMP